MTGQAPTASIVAFYGPDKPRPLTDLVAVLQADLAERIGPALLPRPLDAVHSTLVGLDVLGPVAWPDTSGSGRLVAPEGVDLAGFARHLRTELDREPVTLQLGGFPDRDLGVTSRGRRLHERSLTADRGQLVLVGWPVDPLGSPVATLDRLRRDARPFGIAHRYHRDAADIDADAHLVLAELAPSVPPAALDDALAAGRTALAGRAHRVPLRWEDLRVVLYDDPRLPLATTVVLPMAAIGG
ncbi:MAG: hypothetical protein U0R80_09570 [Nocardioidaceae bacterium]